VCRPIDDVNDYRTLRKSSKPNQAFWRRESPNRRCDGFCSLAPCPGPKFRNAERIMAGGSPQCHHEPSDKSKNLFQPCLERDQPFSTELPLRRRNHLLEALSTSLKNNPAPIARHYRAYREDRNVFDGNAPTVRCSPICRAQIPSPSNNHRLRSSRGHVLRSGATDTRWSYLPELVSRTHRKTFCVVRGLNCGISLLA
jgi:hypothetical protein